jgi:hypothetical protein
MERLLSTGELKTTRDVTASHFRLQEQKPFFGFFHANAILTYSAPSPAWFSLG